MFQERLRFIRKCKKEENRNDDWLAKAQDLIDNEPRLKEILVDLNKLYKAKCRLESHSSPLYNDMLRRLTRLPYRRGIHSLFRFIPVSMLDDTSPSTDDAADEGNADRNPNRSRNGLNETASGISPNDRSTPTQANAIQRTSSTESSDSVTDLSLSDDSLSVGSVMSDRQTDSDKEKTDKTLKRKKPDKSFKSRSKYLKRNASRSEQQMKSSYLVNLDLFTSDSDSSNDDRLILKFKRKKSDRKKKYSAIAFDSDLDLDSDTVLSSGSADSMKARCSKSVHKKRSASEESPKSSDEKSLDGDRRSKRKKKSNEPAKERRSSTDESSDEKSEDSDETSSASSKSDSEAVNGSNGSNALDESSDSK